MFGSDQRVLMEICMTAYEDVMEWYIKRMLQEGSVRKHECFD